MFEGSGGYGKGEQRRDFVFVRDLARMSMFFAFGDTCKAIVKAGAGKSRSFNDVAKAPMQMSE
jgi:ADP-L-glycero-D-manno-heptose 6-epimerase